MSETTLEITASKAVLQSAADSEWLASDSVVDLSDWP